MSKIKIIFSQTLMISTAILFGIGVEMLLRYFYDGSVMIEMPWYVPLSIIFTGFLSSVPTVFIKDMDGLTKKRMWLRIILHFICTGGVVSLCGYLFNWYRSFRDYAPILIMYVIIYCFVWSATAWMAKSDEKKINSAIKGFQDEE